MALIENTPLGMHVMVLVGGICDGQEIPLDRRSLPPHIRIAKAPRVDITNIDSVPVQFERDEQEYELREYQHGDGRREFVYEAI